MRIFVMIVVMLFLTWPVVNALNISNVRAEEITDRSGVVKWETDEAADSFVGYGVNKSDLKTVGDAKSVFEHSFSLSELLNSTTYFFKVKSGGVEDDGGGDFYSFDTLEADVAAPEITAEIPAIVAGNALNVEGETETGVEVRIYVNEMMRGETTAGEDGFSFMGVSLLENEENRLLIEAEDHAGNIGNWTGNVFADTKKPKVEITELPELVDKNEVLVKGTISENCSIEILVNNGSVFKGEGKEFEKKVALQEGENKIKVVVIDGAGWEVVEEFEVSADTAPPQVRFELEKGGEYYQGRAKTDISGETEPGATVYLYVYRRLGYEFVPDFKKAWVKTTADANGSFTFKNVDFECTMCDIEKLAPKEIPRELVEVSMLPLEVIKEVQRWTYHIYVIAEDKTGKTSSAQRTVNVNTCYGGEWAFSVESIAKFQAPLRLDPGLMDEGREAISAWFNFSYQGDGIPRSDSATGREIEPGFRITSVRFEKACTPGMAEDSAFEVGCKILPRVGRDLPNGDKTAHFVTWNLHKAEEMSDLEDDFWNEFRKRRLMFPLKIVISYQERLGETAGLGDERGYGGWSETKTQTTCYDLGYFVDIPLDSQKMLPDWLVDEGVEGLEAVIEGIDEVMPYLEYAILGAGIGCITGFLTKMITRYARIVTSKLEVWFTRLKPDDEKCPANQYGLYLESTIKDWDKLVKEGRTLSGEYKLPPNYETKKLEDRCPNTAGMWKVEAALDQLYRWSCDRVFCRAVPAGWTSEADEDEIATVILKQQQCAVTAAGIPLIEVKDCQKIVEKQTIPLAGRTGVADKYVKNNPSYFCYRTADGDLYIYDKSSQGSISPELQNEGVFKLDLVGNIGTRITEIRPGAKTELLVYKPLGSEGFMVGKDVKCSTLCKNPRRPGYRSDGCYTEEVVLGKIVLKNVEGKKLTSNATSNSYSAGYTSDCFINITGGELVKKQCVCKADEKARKKYESKEGAETWLRTATKEINGVAEPWSYRQATIFKETKETAGTYYSELRYYSGRDLSGAFGADHLLDYVGEKDYHEVNPHTQHIGAFQSVCLSGIRARLVMLRNILDGLKNCLYEAKYTGLHDAGMCKTLFSQHVCGLMYKAIAYFVTDCSPYTFDDVGKGGEVSDIGAVSKAVFSSIPKAMESSISDIKEDYGNAKLNEFFATGVKGFAQSMCMAAFGFDFPMGFDFIRDAAYAVPMKTSVMVVPAERELATYNPRQGTAIYNYNIGAVVLPGCKIRSYKVYLKCVGPEDAGRAGVQCGAQGCDCINLIGTQAPQEAQRIRQLEGGMGFEIKQGEPLSVKIPAPQKIDSLYRYDHVVVELQLDRFEEAEACFDEGYGDGKFYFPIVDVSAPVDVVCQVDIMTGRYYCPELTSFFGKMGLAYLEEPYATCWNARTERWVDCETPNLFMLDDTVLVKVHAVTDGKGQCLKATLTGMQQPLPLRMIPENLPGPIDMEYHIGKVDEAMLSGRVSAISKVHGESNVGCQALIQMGESPQVISPRSFRFNYYQGAGGKYRLTIPQGASVETTGGFGGVSGSPLTLNNALELSRADINRAVFNLDGFRVRNVLGGATFGTQNSCVYQIGGRTGTTSVGNYRDLSVRFDLMYPDENGRCDYTNQLVRTAVGKNSHTQRIRIQREAMVVEEARGMHEAFLRGDYAFVEATAKNIIDRQEGDLTDAVAIYYYVAVDVMKWQKATEKQVYVDHIKQLLTLFFERKTAIVGVVADPYTERARTSGEYEKIKCYLCQIAKKLEITGYNCAGVCEA